MNSGVMNNGTENTSDAVPLYMCEVCGSPVVARSGRGRPALYCSENCRNISKYWGAFRDCVSRSRLSSDSVRMWRSELLAWSNSLNRKGVAS